MFRTTRQLILVLLSSLILCQSVAAVADVIHGQDQSPEQSISQADIDAAGPSDVCTDHSCDAGCCVALTCCETSGCGGECHDCCFCHTIYITMAGHYPLLDFIAPQFSQRYGFNSYRYSDPEPLGLLRPPRR